MPDSPKPVFKPMDFTFEDRVDLAIVLEVLLEGERRDLRDAVERLQQRPRWRAAFDAVWKGEIDGETTPDKAG